MHRRKLQLIGGTTYSLSLPKEWVVRNKLREKSEVGIIERGDNTLIIAPESASNSQSSEIYLNVEDYLDSLDQIIFAVYYLGYETITLTAHKEITKDMKTKIRKSLNYMSGTEIHFEDKQKIVIKVLLDKTKVDVMQLLYRISLILDMSFSNLLEGNDSKEIYLHESEIDRLYHLFTKIVSLSLIEPRLLQTSNLNNSSLIPPFIIISKRLENMGDELAILSTHLDHHKIPLQKQHKEIILFVRSELERTIKYVMQHNKKFQKAKFEQIQHIRDTIDILQDTKSRHCLRAMMRFLNDIQREIMLISFYNELIQQSKL